ncbi:unnamed protein product [Closterium sp. NIES-65]|nr:unnamed protein product [Closterium sp. NIES-65]
MFVCVSPLPTTSTPLPTARQATSKVQAYEFASLKDPKLEAPEEAVVELADIALDYVKVPGSRRPDMKDLARRLQGILTKYCADGSSSSSAKPAIHVEERPGFGGGTAWIRLTLGPLPPLGDGSQATRGPSVPFPLWGTALRPHEDPRSPFPPGGRLSGHTGTLGPLPPLKDGSQATRGPSVPFSPWGTALRPHGDPRSPSLPGGRLSGHTGTLGPLPPLGDGSQATRGPSVPFLPWGTALRPHGDPRFHLSVQGPP